MLTARHVNSMREDVMTEMKQMEALMESKMAANVCCPDHMTQRWLTVQVTHMLVTVPDYIVSNTFKRGSSS